MGGYIGKISHHSPSLWLSTDQTHEEKKKSKKKQQQQQTNREILPSSYKEKMERLSNDLFWGVLKSKNVPFLGILRN